MEGKEYGEFKEVSDENAGSVVQNTGSVGGTEQEGFVRARMPRKGELIGVVLQRLGGNRMNVLASDGKKRNCRVPGKFKRSMWLRPKDTVLITPWVDNNDKADVIFKYNSSQIIQLRKKGLLNSLKIGF